eukprot:1653027-Amphidinium_carterae.1
MGFGGGLGGHNVLFLCRPCQDDADDMDLDDFLDNEAQPEDDPAAERLRQVWAYYRVSTRDQTKDILDIISVTLKFG